MVEVVHGKIEEEEKTFKMKNIQLTIFVRKLIIWRKIVGFEINYNATLV